MFVTPYDSMCSTLRRIRFEDLNPLRVIVAKRHSKKMKKEHLRCKMLFNDCAAIEEIDYNALCNNTNAKIYVFLLYSFNSINLGVQI